MSYIKKKPLSILINSTHYNFPIPEISKSLTSYTNKAHQIP